MTDNKRDRIAKAIRDVTWQYRWDRDFSWGTAADAAIAAMEQPDDPDVMIEMAKAMCSPGSPEISPCSDHLKAARAALRTVIRTMQVSKPGFCLESLGMTAAEVHELMRDGSAEGGEG